MKSYTKFYLRRNIFFYKNKKNAEITIIGTIFIPLTFIAGVYGMNFQHMPELRWHSGYFACLALMLGIALGMLVYFKRKRWL